MHTIMLAILVIGIDTTLIAELLGLVRRRMKHGLLIN